ncbi:MAG: aconitase X catalytic domain-containing protein [Thermoprotei archaeon]
MFRLYLSKTQERMLAGEFGEAAAKAMEILVALGKIYGASRLVRCTSAQISGVSYKNIGDAGADFLWDLAEKGARVRIPSYVNPAGMDLNRFEEMNLDPKFVQGQTKILQAYRRMGVNLSLTCAPYQIGVVPRLGEHIAWAESSAVIFANSVLGAMTNRESGVSALCSAITGYTPYYGYHIPSNRVATLLVNVSAELADPVDYAVLGSYTGRLAGDRIVAFRGITPSREDLKALGAALASTGAVALFFVEGVTPEWRTADTPEIVGVSQTELKAEAERLGGSAPSADVITIGCPHASIEEIGRLAKILANRKLTKPLFVYTSRQVKSQADQAGYTKIIELAGGKIFCDTCMVVSPIDRMGVSSIDVASAKAAYYSPMMSHVNVRLAPLERIILEASEAV